jgi:hypothetical protein
MKIYTSFTHEELNRLQYPVLLELWDKFKDGGKRRKYLTRFDKQEREILQHYYKLFYDWYFRRGTPDEHIMKITTYQFLQEAINWFVQNSSTRYGVTL